MCSSSRTPACPAVGRVFVPFRHHCRIAGQVAVTCRPSSSSSTARKVSEIPPGAAAWSQGADGQGAEAQSVEATFLSQERQSVQSTCSVQRSQP
jgi:hypothetical protein